METQLTKTHTHTHTYTHGLAGAFIDWATGQKEDTKIEGGGPAKTIF